MMIIFHPFYDFRSTTIYELKPGSLISSHAGGSTMVNFPQGVNRDVDG